MSQETSSAVVTPEGSRVTGSACGRLPRGVTWDGGPRGDPVAGARLSGQQWVTGLGADEERSEGQAQGPAERGRQGRGGRARRPPGQAWGGLIFCAV